MSATVVFLCTGNICRSPIAEVVAADMFAGLGLSCFSAGLSAVEGWSASEMSVRYAASRGLDLSGHSAQPVTAELLRGTDWVIGMTRSHAAIFRGRYGHVYNGAIGVLGAPGLDLRGQTETPAVEEVDDPYGRQYEDYFSCGDQIARLLAAWQATFRTISGAAENGGGQEQKP